MTISEINAFVTICQEMSISKAAERLYISQSSLSTKIKTLEKKLGYDLFLRAGKRLSVRRLYG
jgi:DNA-binding transcriptional LysR family regulator